MYIYIYICISLSLYISMTISRMIVGWRRRRALQPPKAGRRCPTLRACSRRHCRSAVVALLCVYIYIYIYTHTYIYIYIYIYICCMYSYYSCYYYYYHHHHHHHHHHYYFHGSYYYYYYHNYIYIYAFTVKTSCCEDRPSTAALRSCSPGRGLGSRSAPGYGSHYKKHILNMKQNISLVLMLVVVVVVVVVYFHPRSGKARSTSRPSGRSSPRSCANKHK